MKPKKARRILEGYLNNHRLPKWDARVYSYSVIEDKSYDESFRKLLKIAYKLEDKITDEEKSEIERRIKKMLKYGRI